MTGTTNVNKNLLYLVQVQEPRGIRWNYQLARSTQTKKTNKNKTQRDKPTLQKIKNSWPTALLRWPYASRPRSHFCSFSTTSETDDAGTSIKFHVCRAILSMFSKQASYNSKLEILNTMSTRTAEERDGSRFLKTNILEVYHILWIYIWTEAHFG